MPNLRLATLRMPTFGQQNADHLRRVRQEAVQRAVHSGEVLVSRAQQRAREITSEIESHQHARAYTSLSTTAFSILDVYSGLTADDSEISLLGQAEAEAERAAEENRQAGAADPRDRTWTEWLKDGASSLAFRIRRRLTIFTAAPTTWLYLVALGVLTAAVGALTEVLAGWASQYRARTVAALPPVIDFVSWTLWCALGACVATAICQLTGSPQAEGSGIPYLKSIMAGTPLANILSMKVLVVKLLGLVAAQGGGLTVGKEGPFVHMAGALAAQLWQLPAFARLSLTETRRRQLLAAAVAAGVTAVFGTPLGGVLFSIEVTSTYTLVSSQWMCFVCAIVTRLAFDAFAGMREASSTSSTAGAAGEEESYTFAVSIPTDFHPAQAWELPILALLGIACGLLGSFFVYAVHKSKLMVKLLVHGQHSQTQQAEGQEAEQHGPATSHDAPASLQESYSQVLTRWTHNHWRRYAVCSAVGLLVSAAVFPTAFLSRADMDVLKDLFLCPTGMRPASNGSGGASHACPTGVWATSRAAAVASLATFLFIRFFSVILSISLPLPCGMFQPLIILGAAMGRLCGELVAGVTATQDGTAQGHGSAAAAAAHSVQPGLYAVVGAAALVSGATHTVSTCLILIELTGQAVHLVPVLLATLLAYTAAGAFTLPVYDVLMVASGMPYLPRVHPSADYAKTAGDVARRVSGEDVLTPNSTYADALRMLQALAVADAAVLAEASAGKPKDMLPPVTTVIPIVKDRHSMRLLGTVDRARLVRVLSGAADALPNLRPGNTSLDPTSPDQDELERSGLLSGAQTHTDEEQGHGAAATAGHVPGRGRSGSAASVDHTDDASDSGASSSGPVAVASTPTRRGRSGSEAGSSPSRVAVAAGVGRAGDALRTGSHAVRHALAALQEGIGMDRDEPRLPLQAQEWMQAPLSLAGLDRTDTGHSAAVPSGSDGSQHKAPAVPLDAAPLSLDVKTPLARLQFLFALLLWPHVLITESGRLVGIVAKEDLCV